MGTYRCNVLGLAGLLWPRVELPHIKKCDPLGAVYNGWGLGWRHSGLVRGAGQGGQLLQIRTAFSMSKLDLHVPFDLATPPLGSIDKVLWPKPISSSSK